MDTWGSACNNRGRHSSSTTLSDADWASGFGYRIYSHFKSSDVQVAVLEFGDLSHIVFFKRWQSSRCWYTLRWYTSSCTPRWYCKRWFRFLRSMHRTRIISISNDSSKSHGYHIQIASLRWTSSGRSICFYPGKNGRCSQTMKHSKIGMSRHLDSSTTTQRA